ncbi:anti-sigma factor antagonist [Streptomyces sp. JNUCC 64]
MTIEWRYTTQPGLGVLSLAGYLGTEAVGRFTGAVGWVRARGTGPVILDLTRLRGWSADGQRAVTEAALRLAAEDRPLHLAAVPDGGPPVPADVHPVPTVHRDLPTALAAHRATGTGHRQWRSDEWPETTAAV